MSVSLDFTRPHVLRDEAELEAAMARVDELLDIDPSTDSAEYDELEFLSVLIEAFEEQEHE